MERRLEKIKKMAHAPYSGHRVGACLITQDGKEYFGFNIENPSYSLTICAERVAFVHALLNGERNFKRIYVTDFPCGACLQFMAEFVQDDFEIVVVKDGEEKRFKFRELYPHPFRL